MLGAVEVQRVVNVVRYIMGRSLSRLVICLIFLAACQPAPQRTVFSEPTYSHLGQIRLDVGKIDVLEAYQPSFAAPNVEHAFPVSPMTVARAWARQRLLAVGSIDSGRAVFTIREASVVDTELPVTEGVRGAFRVDQSRRYDALLTVQLEIFGSGGGQRGWVNVTARRSQTAPEGITLDGRDRLWFAMTEALILDMNRELEARIYEVFGSFLR